MSDSSSNTVSGTPSMADMLKQMRKKLKQPRTPTAKPANEATPLRESVDEESTEKFSDDDFNLSGSESETSENNERFSDEDIVFSSDSDTEVTEKVKTLAVNSNQYANVVSAESTYANVQQDSVSEESSDDSSDEYEVCDDELEEYQTPIEAKKEPEANIGVTVSKVGGKIRPIFTD